MMVVYRRLLGFRGYSSPNRNLDGALPSHPKPSVAAVAQPPSKMFDFFAGSPMAGKHKFNTDHPDPFVQELESIREQFGGSQAKMARLIGVPFRTYQKWIYTNQKARNRKKILAKARALCPGNRLNCWEVFSCGREPGGEKEHIDGPCPAAIDSSADGINGGTSGGRICWAISGTLCGMEPNHSKAAELGSCVTCEFFTQILQEEGPSGFKLLKPGQTYTQT